MASEQARARLGALMAIVIAVVPNAAVSEIPSHRASIAAGHAGNLDVIRIPVPVPVPVPARRPGAPPLDEAEMQEWREARADFLARARLASLPPPGSAAGVVFDAPIVPPVPRMAQRRNPAFIMPFENGRVSSSYNRGRVHPAIDLAGRHGSPVLSTSNSQVVTFAGWYGGYGNAVITRDAQGRLHLYGHLSAVNTKPGMMLAQGERLGALGSTGYSTGPHVHYEVKDANGRHVDPTSLLFPGRAVTAGFTWTDVKLRPSEFASRD
jgi:murein DD-endopeptidase MepM/ murein hydrolase activator NlpD